MDTKDTRYEYIERTILVEEARRAVRHVLSDTYYYQKGVAITIEEKNLKTQTTVTELTIISLT